MKKTKIIRKNAHPVSFLNPSGLPGPFFRDKPQPGPGNARVVWVSTIFKKLETRIL